MIIHPDAYTRTCQACGRAYDASDFDDPSRNQVWMQATCPCCFHGPHWMPQMKGRAEPPVFSSLPPPWAPHTAAQKAQAHWNLKPMRTHVVV